MAKLIKNQGPGSKDAEAVVPRSSFDRLGVDPHTFPRYCTARELDVLVAISPTSFQYLSRMGESKRDEEIIGALPFADVNDRERVWSCDFAMLHGARTEDEVRDWEASVGAKSQSRARLQLNVPAAGATGSVFFDGSDDDVRGHLASIFGTDAFRLEGQEIVLELPLVGYDKRPRPSGETTHVRVAAPEGWTVRASERSWWHVVPDESSATLCGIELSTWQTPPRQDDDKPITCPWCRARMIAVEIASPPPASQPVAESGQPLLHDEIATILRAAARPLTAAEIWELVNSRGHYVRGDAGEIPINQVQARVSNHPELFERQGSQIQLRGTE